jgi:hypothetical protein
VFVNANDAPVQEVLKLEGEFDGCVAARLAGLAKARPGGVE